MSYRRLKQKGINHVCLKVPDLKRTVDFYLNAVDATVVTEWGTDGKDDHAFILDLGSGDFLEIFQTGQTLSEGSWQHLAVWTDDIEASLRRAVEAGAQIVEPAHDSDIPTRSGEIVKMSSAFVQAPGGEMLEYIMGR